MHGRVKSKGQVGGRYLARERGAFVRPGSKLCSAGKPEAKAGAVGATRANGGATRANCEAKPATV